MLELTGQDVLVLGLGLSGRSAAQFCAGRGARVMAVDERALDSSPEIEALDNSIEIRTGVAFPDLSEFDLVVPSPGIPANRWQGKARKAWGDIELCYRALPIPIIAVTGTNGKSTVVRLLESMARAAGLRAQAAGNVGIPALDLVGAPLDLAILEVSSFQLESVDAFRPRVSVLLNVSPDHFDRHRDLDGYLAAKARIFARQGVGDAVVVNDEDSQLAALVLPDGVERLAFHRAPKPTDGAWMDGQNAIVCRHGAQQVVRLSHSSESFVNQSDNLLASLLALAALDIDLQLAAQALTSFETLPHRRQTIARIDGVRYVDDSKATNVGAAIHAIETTSGPIIWIVGGRHKGGDLTPLARRAGARVRLALLIGEAAGEFETAFEGWVPTERVGDLTKAVERASTIVENGDVVLLAPACSSFDQFESFEDRGLAFQKAVAALNTNSVVQ